VAKAGVATAMSRIKVARMVLILRAQIHFLK
jgi:hypothetical protein